MSTTSTLAAFDDARDRFLAAFEQVPDSALGFLKSGDDYAVGGLLVHITGALARYARVLEAVVGNRFAQIRVSEPSGEVERVGEEARRGLDAASRPAALEALKREHDRVAAQMRALPDSDFSRQAPVYYGDAADTFPTSAGDIAGWLTDHYEEHIPHVSELLAAHRAGSSTG
jgi:hypothetical protein